MLSKKVGQAVWPATIVAVAAPCSRRPSGWDLLSSGTVGLEREPPHSGPGPGPGVRLADSI